MNRRMKREMTAEALGMISGSYIEEAAEHDPRRIKVRGLHAGLIAACLLLAAGIGVYAIVMKIGKGQLTPWQSQSGNVSAASVSSDEGADNSAEDIKAAVTLPRPYKQELSISETAVLWPWEYLTEFEQYREAEYEGKKYQSRTDEPIRDISVIGESLGKVTLTGSDGISDGVTHTAEYEAFAVKDADPGWIIAVKLNSGYGIFWADIPTIEIYPMDSLPVTFDNVLRSYGMTDRLSFTRFTEYYGSEYYGANVFREYSLDDKDSRELLRMLAEDVKYTGGRFGIVYGPEADYDPFANHYVTLTVNCPELGINNKAFWISEQGVIETNIIDCGYTGFTDLEDAQKLIAFVKEHSAPAEPDNRESIIGGFVTEVSRDHIKIDDSVLCGDGGGGMVLTIPADDLRIKRCIEYSPNPKVGDIVAVYLRDGSISEDGTVSGAYDLVRASLGEGGGLEIAE